ncbi:MAG: DNA mismatch endonuclease Vsr [Myxococcales bacterium]
MVSRAPSYRGLRSSSPRASKVARASSKKSGTRCEAALAIELRKLGIRYRSQARHLPGCPDFVIPSAKLAIFCDGDFWHGRRLAQRLGKLERGSNAAYWVAKIRSNVARDRRAARQLRAMGWSVLRIWEGDVLRDGWKAAARVRAALAHRRAP